MHNIRIKYKRLFDGVWDEVLREYKVQAANVFIAVADLAKTYASEENVEIEPVSVSQESVPLTLSIGRSYTTLNGTNVRMVGISNENTDYETMVDQFGIHRYSRSPGHIVGRCTGSPINDPMNIKLGLYWADMDFDHDKYSDYNVIRCSEKCSDYVEHSEGHIGFMYRGYTVQYVKSLAPLSWCYENENLIRQWAASKRLVLQTIDSLEDDDDNG